MTVNAVYPDGTYYYITNTFAALKLMTVIHSVETDCPLKKMDLLSGALKKEKYYTAIRALSSFRSEHEDVEHARTGYLEAIQHAMEKDHEFMLFM